MLALIVWAAAKTSDGFKEFLETLGIALFATLVGTAQTLFGLSHLLRPGPAEGKALG